MSARPNRRATYRRPDLRRDYRARFALRWLGRIVGSAGLAAVIALPFVWAILNA